MSLLSKANEAYRNGQYERARDLYQRVIRSNPDLEESVRFNLSLTKTKVSKKTRLSPTQGSIWYWVEQLQQTKRQLPWFSKLAMSTSFEGTREVLAYAATNSQISWEELTRTLESARIPMYRAEVLERLGPCLWQEAWVELATVLYSQRQNEMDLLDSLTMLEILDDLYGEEWLSEGMQRSVYGDLLTWGGKFDRAREVLEAHEAQGSWGTSEHVLRLNTINPNVIADASFAEAWLDSVNTLMSSDGLAPIYFEDGEITFRKICCDAPAISMEDMPRVSVIMPLYEPNEFTDLAIDSLLAQTWSNLEVIIVDDASPSTYHDGSPTPYRAQIEAWAARDDRVKVKFCEANRGTYAVRNDGLDIATGDFVTIADKDDWHHPQKLEIQVRELLAHPDQVANMTNWVRVNEEMRFLVRSRQGHVVYPSFASIMFRRAEVTAKLGYWDRVRKAGDAEFKARLEAAFDMKIIPTRSVPLAFSLVGEGNLTSQDMRPGFISADRRAYNRAYTRWHNAIVEGEADPYLPKNPSSRPFVAPPMMLPERVKGAERQYDVIYLSEFGFLAGNSTSLLQEMKISLDAGLRVGVIPIHNGLIRSAARQQFDPRIESLILEGQVDRLALEDACTADLLIIRWPASFQLNPGIRSGVRPHKVVVIANHMPYEVDGSRRSYDVRSVSSNVEQTFGVRPFWSPQSERLDEFLAPLVPPGEKTQFTWKGIIDPVAPREVDEISFSDTPVIGRHARDFTGKWPSRAGDFKLVYPTDGRVKVKIMGGADVPVKQGHLPAAPGEHWTVYAFNEKPVGEYLRELDFFVYYHGDGLVEAFGMSVLEALNHGVVAVLPPHFEPVFKDAAVYASPQQVIPTIQKLWEPTRYKAQQQKALEFVRAECTPAAYLERLKALGVEAVTPQE